MFIKREAFYLPVFGWIWRMTELIPVQREWKKDKKIIAKAVKELQTFPNPFMLLIFSEGTR